MSELLEKENKSRLEEKSEKLINNLNSIPILKAQTAMKKSARHTKEFLDLKDKINPILEESKLGLIMEKCKEFNSIPSSFTKGLSFPESVNFYMENLPYIDGSERDSYSLYLNKNNRFEVYYWSMSFQGAKTLEETIEMVSKRRPEYKKLFIKELKSSTLDYINDISKKIKDNQDITSPKSKTFNHI